MTAPRSRRAPVAAAAAAVHTMGCAAMPIRLYVPAVEPGVSPPPAARLATGAEFALPPAAARHAMVRRVQPGDPLVLFDGGGGEWAAQVLQVGRRSVTVRVGAHDPVEREAPVAVTLAVAMPANDRMDDLVEKATELGAAAVEPLHSGRSVLRLESDRAQRKVAHWQAIAAAAAEQSGRTRVPAVAPVRALDPWLRQAAATASCRLLLSLADDALPLPKAVPAAADCLLLSGPEGGFSAAEEAAARQAGFVPVSLGARVLRADTAPLAALAWLVLQT
jgi:16S rRNA (uracil1498-N3)-methyltransferase